MKHLHPQFLSVDQAVLIVIDIQERLFTTMTKEGQANLKGNVPILLSAAEELSLPVLLTEQYPKGLGRTIPDIAPKQETPVEYDVVEKIDFASTEEDDFVKAIKATGRKQVVVCGMETHICVYQTVLGLLQLGYQVHVVADASATRLSHNQFIGMGLMQQAGAFVTSTETVLFQLLERAGSDAFKKLQKLII